MCLYGMFRDKFQMETKYTRYDVRILFLRDFQLNFGFQQVNFYAEVIFTSCLAFLRGSLLVDIFYKMFILSTILYSCVQISEAAHFDRKLFGHYYMTHSCTALSTG
jgi:hypothetical protein